MIPDVNLDSEESETMQGQLTEGKFATVGLVFSEDISDDQIKRFERILKCYSDYRHYTPSFSQDNDYSTTEPSAAPNVPTAPPAEQPEEQRSIVPANDGTVASSTDQEQVVY